ncbi:MAG: tricarballylate utilization 4Fe-4S protein TcuB [Piscinibacter sp.]|uniref:tricarballylate utilization 4Fe-4S protein TcuB n=1 Tax=Piscinibacter TaxID=1114981 RepID=UPI000FDE14A5|nr:MULTISPECIES: tricarballylate utilization 4Fe-4S protein TcuB [Piscinibacter]MCW5666251.1 tricarballylate utilization 4Fe-4S protein TcuB [Piscinibacter sp.]
MQSLEDLTREAAALAANEPAARRAADSAAVQEVARVLQICNACRYCEGFCAVFPAMTRRLEFPVADVHYLANLCHNCGACLHACQYAPPHDFALNVPRAMARVRPETYAEYAWPPAFGAAYKRNALVLAVALALALTLFLLLGAASTGNLLAVQADASAFYAVFPHGLLVALFLPVFAFAALALGLGARRFWRAVGAGPSSWPASAEATRHALTLKYLDGGHGEGCNEESDRFTLQRRRFHHLTFYGFMLCFASTGVATLYHYALGQPAPYGFTSLPKLLGVPGGVALTAGTAGLLWLQWHRHALQRAPEQRPMDLGFIGLLLLTAVSGLGLAFSHASAALTPLLCLHLGAVMALFLTLPYGKFAHAVYRGAALLKWSIERRQPSALKLGDD